MVRGHIFSSISPEQKWGEFTKLPQKRDHVKPYHIDITCENVKRRSAQPESRGIEKTGIAQSQIDLVGLLVQKGEMMIREPAGFPDLPMSSFDFAAVFLHHYFLSLPKPQIRYASIPEFSLPFPTIAVPLDNGPNVLSISPAGHGSAT